MGAYSVLWLSLGRQDEESHMSELTEDAQELPTSPSLKDRGCVVSQTTTRYPLYRGLSVDRAAGKPMNSGTLGDSSCLILAPLDGPSEVVSNLVNVRGSRA